jgi:hypothetical protein
MGWIRTYARALDTPPSQDSPRVAENEETETMPGHSDDGESPPRLSGRPRATYARRALEEVALESRNWDLKVEPEERRE